MCLIIPPYDFYVYTLAHPFHNDLTRQGYKHGLVFYVGKGVGVRVHMHEEEARRGCNCAKCCMIREIWRRGSFVKKRVVFTTSDEDEACRRERELIDAIGIHNLTNVHRPPPEARHLGLIVP